MDIVIVPGCKIGTYRIENIIEPKVGKHQMGM